MQSKPEPALRLARADAPLRPEPPTPRLTSTHVDRNPGTPLDLDIVRALRVNRSAVERRAATIPTRLLDLGDPLIGRLLAYDALEQSFRTFKVRRDPECPTCGEHAPPIVIAEYDEHCLPHAVLADGSVLTH